MDSEQMAKIAIVGGGLAWWNSKLRREEKEAQIAKNQEKLDTFNQFFERQCMIMRLEKEFGYSHKQAAEFIDKLREQANEEVESKWVGDYRLQEESRWKQFWSGLKPGKYTIALILIVAAIKTYTTIFGY